MSARINLLPHREERRKRARQHFFVLAGGTAVIGVLIDAGATEAREPLKNLLADPGVQPVVKGTAQRGLTLL